MEDVTEVAFDAGVNAQEAENDRAARTQSGRAQHETILMAVGVPTHIGHAAVAHGATAESLDGRPAVAVDGVPPMDVGNREPTIGDTTEVTDSEEAPPDESAVSAVEAVTADLLSDEIVVDGGTREVTDSEEAPPDDSAVSAVEAVTADLLPDEIVVDEETREVDFGWGIVVGELSLEDFNKISSFPELTTTDPW